MPAASSFSGSPFTVHVEAHLNRRSQGGNGLAIFITPQLCYAALRAMSTLWNAFIGSATPTGVVLCLTLACCHAAADPAPEERSAVLTMERVDGAKSCPDTASLSQAVAEQLGYDPFKSGAEREIVVGMQRDGSGFSGRLELRDDSGTIGERELSADDCAELGRAMSLAIAIAIDPLYPGRRESQKPPPANTTQPAPRELPKARSPRPPKPAPVVRQRAPVHLRLGVGGQVSFGSAPGTSGGFSALTGLGREWWSIDLEGRGDLPASKDAEPSGSVSASLIAGTLVPCAHLASGFVCVLLTAGALQGEGKLAKPKQATTVYAAVGIRGGAELHLMENVSLTGHASLNAALNRTTLEVNGTEQWTMPALNGALGVGVVVRLGL